MIEVRASGFGGCITSQVAALLGYEPMATPDRMQVIFDRGNEHEELNAAVLVAEGWDITRQQEEVRLDFPGLGAVVGHIDGVLGNRLGQYLWESKSPGAWEKFEKAAKTGDWSDPLCHRYAWQISVYMLALGMEALVTCWDETNGIRMFGIETPPYDLDDILGRLTDIAAFVTAGTLPETCSQADYPCPYYYLHDEDEEVVEDAELDMLVDAYEAYLADKKIAEANVKDVSERIKKYLGGRDTLTATSRVTFYEQAAPTRYDYDRMRADGVDVDAYKIAGKPTQRIKITGRDA